jgi:flagellar hook assembly protein FlgD
VTSDAVRISYELTRDADVRLRIIDVTGRVVTTIVSGRVGWGRHEARWDRRGGDGRAVAAGTYFARMDVSGASQSRKITIIE